MEVVLGACSIHGSIEGTTVAASWNLLHAPRAEVVELFYDALIILVFVFSGAATTRHAQGRGNSRNVSKL